MKELDLEQIENLISKARPGLARQLIKKIPAHRVPRHQALTLAIFARRLGMLNQALRILQPIVRAEKLIDRNPTKDELLAYAMTLSLLGVKSGAERIFDSIDKKDNPEAVLRHAFHLSTQWNYARAKALLERYLGFKQINSHQAIIAKVNIVAGEIALRRFDEALGMIDGLLNQLTGDKYQLLRGNVLELKGQAEFHSGRIRSALKSLEDSLSILKNFGGRYLIYAEKWKLLSRLKLDPENSSHQTQFNQIRASAQSVGDWESLRDCDLQWSLIAQDRELFNRVYFGSPLRGYRQSILKSAPGFSPLPEAYWLTEGDQKPTHWLDLETAMTTNGPGLPPGSQSHNLLIFLSSDFYNPKSLGELFELLFPEEYYDPVNSPNRVHQALHKLRGQIKMAEIPLEVLSKKNRFSLKPHEGFGIKLKKIRRALTREEALLYRLKDEFGLNRFNRSQIKAHCGVSDSSADKMIRWGRSKGVLSTLGRGKGTTYSFSKLKKPA